jgi:hypothetical protein
MARHKRREPPRTQRRCGHEFGPWLVCGCGQGIADHRDRWLPDGVCRFEFRTCQYCPATEERHSGDTGEVPTVPDLSRVQRRNQHSNQHANRIERDKRSGWT